MFYKVDVYVYSIIEYIDSKLGDDLDSIGHEMLEYLALDNFQAFETPPSLRMSDFLSSSLITRYKTTVT